MYKSPLAINIRYPPIDYFFTNYCKISYFLFLIMLYYTYA